jgi:hypothetical protein
MKVLRQAAIAANWGGRQTEPNTNYMKRQLSLVVTCALFALAALATARAEDKKADPSGTWTWSTPGRDGGEARKSTLKLKAEGDKLSGTMASPGRQGGEARETAIENGKIKGDEVSFDVTREFGGNKMTAKYSGKIAGDTIKGKIETERDGNTRSRDWEAKREAKK